MLRNFHSPDAGDCATFRAVTDWLPPRVVRLAGVALAGAGVLLARADGAATPAVKPFANSLGMKFVPLPKDEVFFGVWETRNRDYAAFLKACGSPVAAELTAKPDHPIRNVSWDDAVAFCNWLTVTERKAGRLGPQDRYRLPMDREWDKAVGENRWPWGNSWPSLEDRGKLPGHLPTELDLTAPVGSYAPNALGIHDLGGNVMEWCHDWYQRTMNSMELRIEFKRLEDDGDGRTYKILRGQSWAFFDSLNLRSAYRYPNRPHVRGGLYGFRCVLEPDAGARILGPTGARRWAAPPNYDRTAALGRTLYGGRCNECHQHFDPAIYDDEAWSHWIGQMRGKAKMGGDDLDAVDRFIRILRTGKY